MNNTYRFSSTIWIYKGNSPWHFITIDKFTSQEIKQNLLFKPKGFGSIPVLAYIGKSSWKTSIFPHKKDFYILPIKKSIRDSENLNTTSPTKLSIKVII